jgi:hypothetical protein
MLCIRDHGLQESRTSVHGKKMAFYAGLVSCSFMIGKKIINSARLTE